MLEEQLKNEIAVKYFKKFVCTDIINRIDFSVKNDYGYLLWAEAKQHPTDIYKMLAQLIVTIKADAWDKTPPKFLGCFDNEKICFVPFYNVQPVFGLNDFNWTQTPSQVDDKTVETVRNTIDKKEIFTFSYGADDDNIRNFILQNFNEHFDSIYLATQIDKNNFIFVYQKWRNAIMPYINAPWDKLKKEYSVYDRDFFLAELNIDDKGTTDISDDKPVNEDFYITFDVGAKKPYQLFRKDGLGLDTRYEFGFKGDGLDRYAEFWKLYKRPPKEDIWKYIITRLDLLVPQDVRERKGAFFTPQIWVEKSQQYIADVLGADWQDEYYVWDCCAGTGNLLNGLTNKYHIFASTLDQQDVDVMKERIKNGANLLESHVFQFDFLNDEFLPNDDTVETSQCGVSTHGKLPPDLYKIISDPEKRKKLVIYINPPYAEAASKDTVVGSGKNKTDVAILHKTYSKYLNQIGIAGRELFAQFFIRIYSEIPDCLLAEFSKLKILQSPNFNDFRNVFKAKLKKSFLVPANTFDNVNGKFPIGFFIWNCAEKEVFEKTNCYVFNEKGVFIKNKIIELEKDTKSINDWIITTRNRDGEKHIGYMSAKGADFQNQNYNFIINEKTQLPHPRGSWVTDKNIIEIGIYIAVRQCISADWLNDRDQFLFPNDNWKNDLDFQTNCLVYTLFHGQNRISCKQGTNHWIPFSEEEVNAKGLFDSHFMKKFLDGKIKAEKQNDDLFSSNTVETRLIASLQFGETAKSVLSAGRELWRYYHTMEDANTNASLVDIKEYFQGRNEKGTMNSSSNDPIYTDLLDKLKTALRALGEKIKPKVYEYGFLR